MTERISLDGEPIERGGLRPGVQRRGAVHPPRRRGARPPAVVLRDRRRDGVRRLRGAPVDAAVVEVGMGGAWDATNVIDAKVAVLTPIAVDHAKYLGETPAAIAVEKVGIIKSGTTVVTAVQSDEVMALVVERCAEVGAPWSGKASSSASPPGARSRRPGDRAPGPARQLRRGLHAALRSPPGAERGPRAGGGRGVRRRRRRPRHRGGPRPSPRSPRRAGWRSSGAPRRSCSTRPTTRTEQPPPSPRWRTRSPSRR